MTYLDFAGLIGTLVLLACAVIGLRQVWGWIQAGYRLEQKHIRLGRGCVLITDEELMER